MANLSEVGKQKREYCWWEGARAIQCSTVSLSCDDWFMLLCMFELCPDSLPWRWIICCKPFFNSNPFIGLVSVLWSAGTMFADGLEELTLSTVNRCGFHRSLSHYRRDLRSSVIPFRQLYDSYDKITSSPQTSSPSFRGSWHSWSLSLVLYWGTSVSTMTQRYWKISLKKKLCMLALP